MPARHPSIADAIGRARAALAHAGLASFRDLRILVAWSGGPDSGALLGLLHLLAPTDGLSLHVGHVHHGLRLESDEEADLVEGHCRGLAIPCTIHRLGLAGGANLAARARDARRASLLATAAAMGADLLAFGHTATDQAETMLMHLARGAGLRGLSGMAAVEPNPIGPTVVRPLLDLSRPEARALAHRLEVPFVDDPTNVDPAHLRVRVREGVLPVLRQRNPGADRAVAATARAVGEAEDALTAWAARELAGRRVGANGHRMDNVSSLPRAVRTRLVRAACLTTVGDPDAIPRTVVDGIDRALAAGGRARHWDLHGFRVSLAGDLLQVEPVSGLGPATGKSNH